MVTVLKPGPAKSSFDVWNPTCSFSMGNSVLRLAPRGYPWPPRISFHPTFSSVLALCFTLCLLKSSGVSSLTHSTFGSSSAIQVIGYKRKGRSGNWALFWALSERAIYWCVLIGSLHTEREHWDGEDEKDIHKWEQVLFSINSFSFSHLPVLNLNIWPDKVAPLSSPCPPHPALSANLALLPGMEAWRQLVFSFAVSPCLKFHRWFIILFINEGLNSLSFSLNCMILLASSHSTLAQTGQIWCFSTCWGLALHVVELILSAWGGWVCWSWELREKERKGEKGNKSSWQRGKAGSHLSPSLWEGSYVWGRIIPLQSRNRAVPRVGTVYLRATHKIIESQNGLGWKGPQRSPGSNPRFNSVEGRFANH